MLNPAKASPVALRNAAQSLLDKKKYAEAELYLIEVLNRDVNDHAALALLGEVYIAQRRLHDAFAYYAAAIRANPAELIYKERFIEVGGGFRITRYDPLTDHAIVECLKAGDDLDCMNMYLLWVTHMTSEPAFHAAFRLEGRRAFDPANKKFYEELQDFKPLFTPTFLLGIRHIPGGGAVIEEFVTHLRKHLLEDEGRDKKKFTSEETLSLATAISHYSFGTDYILDVTPQEQQVVDALCARIEGNEKAAGDAALVALLACYRPLYQLKNAAQFVQTFSSGSPDMHSLIQQQVLDYDELQKAAVDVKAITPIDDSVSLRVREQYEEFPYPRWKRLSQQSRTSGWKSRQARFAGGLYNRKIKILIAGCGTGQEAVKLGSVFPQAEILAVDLSRTSLAYAIKKTEEHGIKNVTFRQADILRLGSLDQKFDFITSMGVLHHLQDPVKGWEVLYGLLKPGGDMMVGLYSKIARRKILKAQAAVKQAGCAGDIESMKTFRRNSPQVLEREVLNDLVHYRDYYFMSMYRDLLFHVQEHDYDIPEIEGILNHLNLSFAGFSLRDPVLAEYKKEYQDDHEMTNLKNWTAFEDKNPNIFKEMYYMWCRKSKNQADIISKML